MSLRTELRKRTDSLFSLSFSIFYSKYIKNINIKIVNIEIRRKIDPIQSHVGLMFIVKFEINFFSSWIGLNCVAEATQHNTTEPRVRDDKEILWKKTNNPTT